MAAVALPYTTSRRSTAAVYRRRRLLAGAAVAGLVYASAHAGAAFLGGGPLAVSRGPGSAVPVAEHVYVVQPGDTVWSIAHQFQPTGDERPLVDAIVSELGGAGLTPGEAIRIP